MNQNRSSSKFTPYALVALFIAQLLILVGIVGATPQSPNFVGNWQMTMEGGGPHGGGGGNNGGNNGDNGGAQGQSQGEGRGHGGVTQTLAIAKDGDAYKVTHTTPRGSQTSHATVSGNSISWTETRPGRDGNVMKLEFKATLDGDTMTGSFGGGQFTRQFTAKRGS